mgnify:CR=1 FL=1
MSNYRNENKSIPTIGMQGFRDNQIAGREELIFNEILGQNIIRTPHKHDFFIIILFDKGDGIHNIDSIDYPIGNREVHVLFPKQMHKWTINDGTVGYQLMIEKSFLEKFAPAFRFSFTNYQNHPVIHLPNYFFSQLLYEFNAIRLELLDDNPIVELISARASIIAALVSKVAENDIEEFKVYQTNPRLAKFNWLIDKFYKEQKAVTFYADQLNISANYLNILCQRNLRISANRLIQQRITVEAKRFLSSSEKNIKQIAFELGFSDHAYFSNFFKNQTGLTPSKFREQL